MTDPEDDDDEVLEPTDPWEPDITYSPIEPINEPDPGPTPGEKENES